MKYTLLICTALVISSTPTLAQSVCSPRDEVLKHLAEKYGEAPIALGVTNKGGLVEVLATSDGSTWTIIVSMPNGTSCLVASGEGWRTKEHKELSPHT